MAPLTLFSGRQVDDLDVDLSALNRAIVEADVTHRQLNPRVLNGSVSDILTALLAGRIDLSREGHRFDLEALSGAVIEDTGGDVGTGPASETLFAIERSTLFRPPILPNVRLLEPGLVSALLSLAPALVEQGRRSSDPRYANVVLKLVGFAAAWLELSDDHMDREEVMGWIAPILGFVDDLVDPPRFKRRPSDGMEELRARRLLDLTRNLPSTGLRISDRPSRLAILSTVASSGLGLLLARLSDHLVASDTVVLLRDSSDGLSSQAATTLEFDRSCFPDDGTVSAAERSARTQVVGAGRAVVRTIDSGDWDSVRALLKDRPADMGVLVGMPIVPADVLDLMPIGTINAHNGQLPDYRGMDAVAWALWNGDDIWCTTHEATASVDAGPVLLDEVVRASASSLRVEMKLAQVGQLDAVAKFVICHGHLPAGREQKERDGRLYFRMHAELRRRLRARTNLRPRCE